MEKSNSNQSYWITPVGGDEINSGEDIVKSSLTVKGFYGLGKRTPGRKGMKTGDWLCFYVTGKGVVAHARLAVAPMFEPGLSPLYPFVLHLEKAQLYLQKPKSLELRTRARLDAFRSRSLKDWGWFVTTTHRLSKHDFELLTDRTPYNPQSL